MKEKAHSLRNTLFIVVARKRGSLRESQKHFSVIFSFFLPEEGEARGRTLPETPVSLWILQEKMEKVVMGHMLLIRLVQPKTNLTQERSRSTLSILNRSKLAPSNTTTAAPSRLHPENERLRCSPSDGLQTFNYFDLHSM